MLRAVWVQLHLIDGRNYLPGLLQVLQIGDRPIRDANGLHLPCGKSGRMAEVERPEQNRVVKLHTRTVNLLQLRPGFLLIPVSVYGSRTIRIDW
jgi:hypothetical protein